MKIQTKKHFLLLLALLFCRFAFAGAEFLPAGKDQAQMTKSIVQLVPFAGNSADSIYYQRMTDGLASLRKEFKQFDTWSAEKPNPIRIEISKTEEVGKDRGLEMTPAAFKNFLSDEMISKQIGTWTRYFASRNYFYNSWQVKVANFRQYVNDQVIQSIRENAEGPRGILTGLIQVLPPDQRAEIFKANDPEKQIQLLRKAKLSDEKLQKSNFRPEVAGLAPSKLTVENVLEEAERRLGSTHIAIQNIFTYLYLAELTDLQVEQLTRTYYLETSPSKFLNPKNTGALSNINSIAFASLFEQFAKSNPDGDKEFRNKFAALLSILPRSAFQAVEKKSTGKSQVPFLTVTEVHPYLAYFRGCVGGDCSTSTSPLFPLSPWEHVFFIQDKNGEFLGYASATRTIVNGESTFYLKDISGNKLSADNAEAILHAFAKVYTYFGTKKFAIASPSFTVVNNHFPLLRTALAKYTDQQPLHKIRFPDEAVRFHIGNNYETFGSNYRYDSPETHSEAVFFKSNPFRENLYSYDFHPGTLTPFKPETPKDSLLLALNYLAADPHASLSDLPKIVDSEVRSIANTLRNKTGTNLKLHYATLTEQFARYGIELSRSFRNNEERLFAEGHLLASDAMSVEDSSLVSETVRIFSNYVRRHGSIELIANFAIKWHEQLNQSKRFSELVDLLTERADARDVVYLLMFADAGIPAAQKSLKAEKVSAKVPEAITRFLSGQGIRRVSSSKINRALLETRLFKMAALVETASEQTSKKFVSDVAKALSTFNLSKKDFENEALRNQLTKYVLKTKDAFTKENRDQNLHWIQSNATESDFDAFEVLLKNPNQMKKEAVAATYVDGLIKSLTASNIVRLAALAEAGYPAAQAFLKLETARPLLVRTAYSLAKENLSKSDSVEIYQVAKNHGYLKGSQDFFGQFNRFYNKDNFESLDSLYTSLHRLMAPHNIEWSDLFSVPEVMEKVSDSHLKQSLLDHPIYAQYFGFTMRFIAFNLLRNEQSPSFRATLSSFDRSIHNYYSSPDYTTFLRTLIRGKQNGCTQCGPFLKGLVAKGAVPIVNELDVETLLIETHPYADRFAKFFAHLELRRRKVPRLAPIAEHEYAHLVSSAIRGIAYPGYLHPDIDIKNLILDDLIQMRRQFQDLHSGLYDFLRYSDNMVLAYKAGIALLKDGFHRDYLISAIQNLENRVSFSKEKSNPEQLHWKKQFEKILANKNSFPAPYVPEIRNLSCQKLFKEYTKK